MLEMREAPRHAKVVDHQCGLAFGRRRLRIHLDEAAAEHRFDQRLAVDAGNRVGCYQFAVA